MTPTLRYHQNLHTVLGTAYVGSGRSAISHICRSRSRCPVGDGRHRHGRIHVAQNTALTRTALLAIIPFDEDRNLSSLSTKTTEQRV